MAGVGAELSVDGVADPSFEAAHRFLAALPLGLFVEAVRAARVCCDCADLQRKYNDAILHSTDRTATEAEKQASLEAADAALQPAVDLGCVSF